MRAQSHSRHREHLRLEAAARPLALLGALLAAALGGGCGSTEEGTPAACLQGPGGYSRALQSAPQAVRLSGGAPISTCLTPNQAAGDIARAGSSMLTVAIGLNSEARGAGGGTAAERLGYLIGAVERGAEDTGGIHANLVDRLKTAARLSPAGSPLPATAAAAYARGVRAGRSGG